MCGRFTLTVSHRPDLAGLAASAGYDCVDRYNIAPQQPVLVLDAAENYRVLPWDYSPPWAKQPMHLSNARSETLREKPSFRGAKRCVFLADGWYEWQRDNGQKCPWYHHIGDELLFFAGIYNETSGAAIVTRAVHENLAHIHHRQPVLLERRAVAHWLEGHDLFASAITRSVSCHRVSRAVNSASHQGVGLIAPATDEAADGRPAGESGDLFL